MEDTPRMARLGAEAALTLRPVTAADAEAVARLVVQLVHAEAPGTMRGPHAGQVHLFTYLIGHELADSTRGRFLAVDELGSALGSASVRLAGDISTASLPPRLLSVAARSIGLLNTARLLGTMLRGSLAGETSLRRGECFIYSVVVDEAHRGRGVGLAMMEQLEAHARVAGARAALLRVIVGNAPARALYLRLGYRVVGRTPVWADGLILPSELLRKELV
jgi:ribosomal protein S18 acetylase RimI-like enzyme